jgi:hypothetical protein
MTLRHSLTRIRKALMARAVRRPRMFTRRPRVELLEDRTLLSISLGGIPSWVAEGPAPITGGNTVIGPTAAMTQKVGAINAIAVDPNNAKHLFAATVNGGIWQTLDFTVATPTWSTTTDLMPSLAIKSIAFSPVSSNVIYAGTGSYSSLFTRLINTQINIDGNGGRAVGVYKSIDGGKTWQIENPGGIFSGLRIIRIIPTTLNGGQTVFAATTDGGGSGGVFRSDTGGTTWTRLSGGSSGLPNSGVTDLVENPNNTNQFFAATSNTIAGAGAGVYELDVTGGNTTWVNVTNNMVAGDLSASDRIELAISPFGTHPIWASIINATRRDGTDKVTTQGEFYQRVYRGIAGGGTVNWTQVGPSGQPPDIFQGNQGDLHGAIVAAPNSDTLVYLSGDRTNVSGKAAYIARGDSGANTWTAITFSVGETASGDAGTVIPTDNGDTTAPHADSRGMTFGFGGVLLCTSDGGAYQGTNPASTTPGDQTWTSIMGATTATTTGIQDTEMYNLAYDHQFHILFGGSQDNGTPSQGAKDSLNNYNDQSGGDGGATAVDNFSLASMNESTRYYFGTTRKLWNGADTRVAGDNDASILNPGSPLAGLTIVNPNDAFAFSVTNAVAGRIVIAGGTSVTVGGVTTTIPNGALYESSDAGSAGETKVGSNYYVNDNWTQIPTDNTGAVTGIKFKQAGAVAAGGMLNGLPNPDVLYVASGANIFLRGKAGDTVTATAGQPGGGNITAIALDPSNWKTAVVTDGSNVYMTTDGGGSWTTITGNLSGLSGSVSFLAVVAGAGVDAVLVGAVKGVFRMITTSPKVWTLYGAGLPRANTGGMVYDTADDVLVAATYGRGAWEVPNASATVFTAGALNINGDTDYPGENDTIKLVIDPSNTALLDVYLNSLAPVYQVPLALLNQINVNGLGGNDTLIVDSTNGLINVPNGINYDGGTGFNTLELVQTGGPTRTSDTYSVGPNNGMGISTISDSSGTQTIFFQNLAPVQDNVSATTDTVNGTPANNAVNYTQGPGGGIFGTDTTGLVTVDNQESYEFSQKTNLVINSGAGVDTVGLNNATTPTGLSGITVTGGDPTSFDTLILNGVGTTVGVNVGTRSIAGATGAGGAVPILYNTFESLIVNAGPSTTLAVSGSASFVVTPATAADAGTVQTSPIPISFTGVGSGKTLSLTGLAGSSSLVVNGTTGDDTFTVATSGNVAFAGRATIATASIPNLTINGIGGSDTFNVTGPQTYTSITLAGGGPAASQVANVTGNGSAAMTANLGGTTASVTGGGLAGPVSLPGIGVLNLSAGGAAITLKGTPGPDAFTVTPTGANTATAQVGALAPVVNTTNSGSLTVDGNGGSDTLAVNGTSAADTIGVNGTSVAVNSLKVVNYINVPALQVNGLAGSDTFNVTSSATVAISIDGGDPVGVLPGDLLNVVTNPGDTVGIFPGPTSDSGGVVVNANQPISYVHIESLSITGGGTPVINGTNGNDVITIIARDGSYAAGLDGVQDFTVSINGGPNILFINTPTLVVHALAGDDQIVVQAPAPNLLAWNVNLTLDGGPSSALGDQLVVSALGTDTADFAPSLANSGTLGITNAAGNVTNIQMVDIENFVYDGQSGNDNLTVEGTPGNNSVVVKPGATNDAGTVAVDSLLPVAFQNLGTGAGARVIVNGNGGIDAMTYYGTPVNDTFIVASSTTPAGGQVNLNARVPVVTTGIPTLTLEGVAGDDTFTLAPTTIATSPYATLNLHGGPPASATGSQANLTAAAGMALTVSGQTIQQGAVTVAGSGLANENLNGAGNTLTYNGVASVTEAINIVASATANQGQISVPGVALWTFTSVPVMYANGNSADNDTLTFTGTNNSETYQINLAAAGTNSDPVLQLQDAAAVNTLLTLANYTGFQTLNIAGLDGADVFNVLVAPVTTIPGRQIFINGDLPSGKKKLTDSLNVVYAKPKPKIVHSTSQQDPDAGLVSADYGTGFGFFLIQFDGIENVSIHQQ